MAVTHSKVSGVANDASGKVGGADWDADHVGTVADSDYSEQNTSSAYATSAAIISRTVTLRAGRYHVDALIRTSTMTSAGSPGTLYLRKGGTKFTNGTEIDMRPTADTQFNLFGYFDHTGGEVIIDVYFLWEAGTTRFGLSGTSEVRFGQKLMIMRVGDAS